MRNLMFLAMTAVGLYGAARWWRDHRRAGADAVNRIIDPWLLRRGLISGSRGAFGLIEHVGRTTGTVRRTPIHPMPTADGFRIIVPVGEQSEWARNVLASGHCRLVLGDRSIELDEPVLQTPAEVPGLPRPVRALFGWLGFRYLHLRTAKGTKWDAMTPRSGLAPNQREPVLA